MQRSEVIAREIFLLMIYNDQSKMKNIAGPWQLLQQENASFS
jgi:hypothetical protein